MPKNILCADIGGTNSRFAHFRFENGSLILCEQYICPTESLQNTKDLLEAASKSRLPAEKADFFCLGFAGPIDNDGLGASLTNGKLSLDFHKCSWVNLNSNFLLVNDFVLQAYASLVPDLEVFSINNKPPSLNHVRTIIGAGTGLGVASLIPIRNSSFEIFPSEGGHTDMPFYGKEELNFASFALAKLGEKKLSAEDVLSAHGLSLIHTYFSGQELSPPDVAKLFMENNYKNEQANLYAGFLGRFCKNLALTTLCQGGLYFGGGVLIKNPQLLQNPNFFQEFYETLPKMQNILKNIPIILIKQENATLWGAAYLAKNKMTSCS